MGVVTTDVVVFVGNTVVRVGEVAGTDGIVQLWTLLFYARHY
jgi:hypothetical protein